MGAGSPVPRRKHMEKNAEENHSGVKEGESLRVCGEPKFRNGRVLPYHLGGEDSPDRNKDVKRGHGSRENGDERKRGRTLGGSQRFSMPAGRGGDETAKMTIKVKKSIRERRTAKHGYTP